MTRIPSSSPPPAATACPRRCPLLPIPSTRPTATRRHHQGFRAISLSAMATPVSKDTKRVVVCGGGVIGACTTFFLSAAAKSLLPESPHSSAPDVEVTLVEKSSVACAASGKAGGFLALDWCDGSPLSNLAPASFRLHRSLADALGGAAAYGYRPVHTLSFSFDDKTPASSSSVASSLPAWIDGPARHPRTIGTTETTAQVHPQLFTRKLVSAAVEGGGVEVVTGEVERVEIEGGRAVGVVVRRGDGTTFTIPADAVVLAMGPWSSRLPLVSALFRVSGLKAHSIVLRPPDPATITPHALFLSYVPPGSGKALDPEVYVYPRPTGEVYVCGMSKDEEVPDDPEEIVGDPESIAMLHKIASTVSTQLVARDGGVAAEVVAEQACFLPCTDDGLPVIGEIPGAEECYVATGHSCWGILNGPATGAALAELIMDGKTTTVDLKPFSPTRFLRRGRLG